MVQQSKAKYSALYYVGLFLVNMIKSLEIPNPLSGQQQLPAGWSTFQYAAWARCKTSVFGGYSGTTKVEVPLEFQPDCIRINRIKV